VSTREIVIEIANAGDRGLPQIIRDGRVVEHGGPRGAARFDGDLLLVTLNQDSRTTVVLQW
jgi:hypothetical protein